MSDSLPKWFVALFARYKILILWTLSVDQLPLATVDSLSFTSFSCPLSLLFTEFLCWLISVCIMLQLSQLTRLPRSVALHYDRRFFLFKRCSTADQSWESKIMRDNTSESYARTSLGGSVQKSSHNYEFYMYISAEDFSPFIHFILFLSLSLFAFCYSSVNWHSPHPTTSFYLGVVL